MKKVCLLMAILLLLCACACSCNGAKTELEAVTEKLVETQWESRDRGYRFDKDGSYESVNRDGSAEESGKYKIIAEEQVIRFSLFDREVEFKYEYDEESGSFLLYRGEEKVKKIEYVETSVADENIRLVVERKGGLNYLGSTLGGIQLQASEAHVTSIREEHQFKKNVSGSITMTDIYGVKWKNSFDCTVSSTDYGKTWSCSDFTYLNSGWVK